MGPARAALKTLRGTHPTGDLVFVRADGGPIKSFRKSWLAAQRRAGLAGKRFHGTMRLSASNLISAGIIPEPRRMTRHKDARTLKDYRVALRRDILTPGKML